MSRFADRQGPIRLGMVGGGEGAFIGAVHRIAARLDGHYTLVAGALSASADKARASGRAVGLAEDRTYDDFTAMAQREARLKDGIEAVAIVTPNHLHYPVAREFLKRGIHVICDKPLTATMADAKRLAKAVEASGAVFALTHVYTGYPMVRQAREMVAEGALGRIRLAQVEYPQGWLADAAALDGKQAQWRNDPERSGEGGAVGDIGTHAFNLMRFVTGLEVEELAAELHRFGAGRRVDDNGHVMLRLAEGARGTIWFSQVAVGQENGLRLRVYGERGGLEWAQETPEYLWHTPLNEPSRRITRSGAGNTPAATAASRIPAGHPEGFLEAFAGIYRAAAAAIVARRTGSALPPEADFPGLQDGLEGMRFVEACLRSSARNAAWMKM
jgi:predicted dehydrogenase